MPRSWAIQTCELGAWATWNVEVICLRLRHCDFLPQDCVTERGYVRLIPTLGTWKTQVLDKPSVDVLFKCMSCNSQAISDLLPSAVPRTLQIANGSNQETKEKHMFQCFLAAMCSIEEQMLWQLDVLILFGFERMPILLQMGRSSRLATVRIRSGIWGEWGWNFYWKWCSDIGIIFKSFSISTSILKVVQPSPKVKIGFSGTGPWSFAEEFLPSRTHGSPCGAMLSWRLMESMCWKMTFLSFFKKSGNILYGMMWMLMPLSFWASGGDGGVGITIEMAFSSCGNPTTTQWESQIR